MILDPMQYGRRIGLFICLALFMTQTVLLAQVPAYNKVLQIGLLPTLTARTLLKNYQPLQIYLERELKRPVELSTAPDFRTFHLNTIEGKYDLVLTAAHLARLAQTKAKYLPLTCYISPNQALLFEAKDKPLRSIKELKGKRLAFGDRNALIVSQTVNYLLLQGLREGIDYTTLEAHSHTNAAYSVQNHQSDLAVIGINGLKSIPEVIRDGINVHIALPEVPSLTWMANPRMASEVPKIKAVLIGFTSTSREGKEFYDATDYVGMREMTSREMKTFEPYAKDITRTLESTK